MMRVNLNSCDFRSFCFSYRSRVRKVSHAFVLVQDLLPLHAGLMLSVLGPVLGHL